MNGERLARRAARTLGAVALTGLGIGLVGALLAPGYAPPERFSADARPLATAPPAVDAGPVTVTEVEVQLRGEPRRGQLTSPDNPVLALVYVHGGGGGTASAADELAHALASAGIAVLAVDKVMAGYDWASRDYDALAEDAADSALWLGDRLGLPTDRVGLAGVSEGGWVSLLAAANRPDLTGPLLLVSAPLTTPLEQSVYLATGRIPDSLDPLRRVIAGMLASGRPIINYLDHDVRGRIASLDNRVVAVYGSHDPVIAAAEAIHHLGASVSSSPSVLVVDGGHVPPPELWAPIAGGWLLTDAHGPTVATVDVDPGLLKEQPGAARPPGPSPLTNPLLHLLIAAILVGAVTAIRRVTTRKARP